MSAISVFAAPVLTHLATNLVKRYVAAGHPQTDVPSIDDLKTLIARLIGNEIGGPIDPNLPNAIDSVRERISFLKHQKGLPGVTDFLSKGQLISLQTTCLADIGAERPQVDPSEVSKATDFGKDFCYMLGEPFPTVRGNVEEAKRLVKQAFQVWRRVAKIRFADFTDHPDACDLIIVERAIDAAGGTLAVGTVGGGPGEKQVKELVFDANERDWTDRGKFFVTACHETGHLLGLAHGGAIAGDLMWPTREKSIPDAIMDQLEDTNPGADDVLQDLATGKLRIDGGQALLSKNDIDRAVSIWGEPPKFDDSPALVPRPEDVTVCCADESPRPIIGRIGSLIGGIVGGSGRKSEDKDHDRDGTNSAKCTDHGVFPVWFGTNRQRASEPSQRFSSEQSSDISYGRVDVWIPKAHRSGEIGSSLLTRIKRFDLRDDHLRIQKIQNLESVAFWAELQSEMKLALEQGDPPHALVYLHGYRVSFEDAAIRAAQLGFDLKVPGATAFFSWPSCGTLLGYASDTNTIRKSVDAITDFLVNFAQHSGAEKIHLIAHSMGNLGLVNVLKSIADDAATRSKVRFGQIFLAAPDVDRDTFLELAHLYPALSERTTLYASKQDWAVYISSRIYRAARAGYFKPYTVANGIDTITVPDFDIDWLGHSFYAQAEALLNDMSGLIRENKAPSKRRRIFPKSEGGMDFWEMSL